MLEPIFKRQPQHPGVAHYLIHLYDYPPIAEKGLEAAQALREDRAAAPHAQHMPSHIFTRVGYWQEFDRVKLRRRRVSRRRTTRATTSCTPWTTSSTRICSLRRTRRRRAVIEEMNKVSGFTETFIAGPYALAASPARYARRARRLEGRGGALRCARALSPHVQAMTHFARALGAARSGNAEAAKTDIDETGGDCAKSCCQGRLLVEHRRYPAAGRACLGALRRGQAGRGARRRWRPRPMPRTRPRSTR